MFDSRTFMKTAQMVVCNASDFLALQSEFAKHFSALQAMGKTVSTVLTHFVCTL